MKSLRQRMLRGLEEYKKIFIPIQISDHSEPDIEDDIDFNKE